MSKTQSTISMTQDDEEDISHIMMPSSATYPELAELEFMGVEFYDDGVGNLWAVSHNDQEYDLVQAVLDAHD